MDKSVKKKEPAAKPAERRGRTRGFAALLALMCVSSVAVYGAASGKEKIRYLGEAVFASSGGAAAPDDIAATPVGASVYATDIDAMAEAYIEGELDVDAFFEDVLTGETER